MKNPLRILSRTDRALWLCSLTVIAVSGVWAGDLLFTAASVIGITSLIFAAKGHPLGQVLMIVFSLCYGGISFFFRYYGEMLTYLGMTLPMSVISLITWLRNPCGNSRIAAVRQHMSARLWVCLLLASAAVTALLGWLLALLHTANLAVSTLSVTTSFAAAFLTACRSPLFALAYAANDLVLIVLWLLAARSDPACLPMVICFCVFLVNDLYGFLRWHQRGKAQAVHAD